MITTLNLPSGQVKLPAFFADATYAAVRATGFDDVYASGLQGLEMNTYHLYNRPGGKLIKAMGGLSAFTGYKGAILTDSGGFQLYSMIRENSAYGEIREKEILFRPDMGAEKVHFTPEKCIQAQFMYKSDIMMALDMCTHPNDDMSVQKRAVDLTVKWAARCRLEFDRLAKSVKGQKPLLFAIVQGGRDRALRLECGQRLEEIGFDGYGFGGWPTDENGEMLYDVLQMAADAMPDGKVKYAMGVGRPEEIVKLTDIGYSLFDCVIPTREARHKRLYAFNEGVSVHDEGFYKFIYIMDDKYTRDDSPIEPDCDCPMCRNHSRAYLQHLFKMGDLQAQRLATAHNLRFYARLTERLRNER